MSYVHYEQETLGGFYDAVIAIIMISLLWIIKPVVIR